MTNWIRCGFNSVHVPVIMRDNFDLFVSKFNAINKTEIVPEIDTSEFCTVRSVKFFDKVLKVLYDITISDLNTLYDSEDESIHYLGGRVCIHSRNMNEAIDYFSSPNFIYIDKDTNIKSLDYGPVYIGLEEFNKLVLRYELDRENTKAIRFYIPGDDFEFDVQLGNTYGVMFESLRTYNTLLKYDNLLRITNPTAKQTETISNLTTASIGFKQSHLLKFMNL